jgi:hypothetical protein
MRRQLGLMMRCLEISKHFGLGHALLSDRMDMQKLQ